MTTRLALLACSACALACVSPVSPVDRARGVAERTVRALERGDAQAAAAQLHYPPSYSASERAEDAAAVATSLSFLLNRFGRPARSEPRRGAASFFEVGAGGGDMPYWQSLSPFRTLDFVYDAWFEHFGPGFLVVRVLVPVSGPAREVQRMGFALPIDPPSKRRIAEATRDLFSLKGRGDLPIEQLLDRIEAAEIAEPAI